MMSEQIAQLLDGQVGVCSRLCKEARDLTGLIKHVRFMQEPNFGVLASSSCSTAVHSCEAMSPISSAPCPCWLAPPLQSVDASAEGSACCDRHGGCRITCNTAGAAAL